MDDLKCEEALSYLMHLNHQGGHKTDKYWSIALDDDYDKDNVCGKVLVFVVGLNSSLRILKLTKELLEVLEAEEEAEKEETETEK